ncbi:MAG: hypothetical protein IJN84_07455 [Clostridia bacterium]|nr:hypothetical protein [Clostridia bacterium]
MRYKIFKDNEHINTIIADESFIIPYCQSNGYIYEEEILPEPEPTPKPPTADVSFDELAAAIKEGVNAI